MWLIILHKKYNQRLCLLLVIIMLNTTAQKAIPLLAAGQTQQAVADQLGITQPSVFKIAHKTDVKKLVEAAQLQLVHQGTQIAIDSQIAKLKAGKAIISNQHNPGSTKPDRYVDGVDNGAILQLADKVEQRLLQSVGILPSNMQSATYIQLIAGRDIHLSHDVVDVLRRHLGDVMDAEVVDQV